MPDQTFLFLSLLEYAFKATKVSLLQHSKSQGIEASLIKQTNAVCILQVEANSGIQRYHFKIDLVLWFIEIFMKEM